MNTNQNQHLLSSFTIRQGVATHNPLIPLNAANYPFFVNDQGWFDPQNYGNSFNCSSNGVCMAYIAGGGDDEYRISVASDSAMSTLFIPESKIIAQQLLYEELVDDSTLLNSNSLYQDFVSSNQNTSIEELQNTRASIEATVENDEITKLVLKEKDSAIIELTTDIKVADSLFSIQPDSILSMQRESMLQDIETISLEVQQEIQNLKMSDASLINLAISQNTGVNTSQIPLSNESMVNEVQLNYMKLGAIAIQNEFDNLLQVAFQCPYMGGPAVYRARALLHLINDSLMFDDISICGASGIYRMALNNEQQESSLNPLFIFPNPGKDYFTLLLSSVSGKIERVEVSDIQGKIVFHKECSRNDGMYILNLTEADDAMYIVKVITITGERFFGKIVVRK